jgi:hypothetical protein
LFAIIWCFIRFFKLRRRQGFFLTTVWAHFLMEKLCLVVTSDLWEQERISG